MIQITLPPDEFHYVLLFLLILHDLKLSVTNYNDFFSDYQLQYPEDKNKDGSQNVGFAIKPSYTDASLRRIHYK